MNFLNKVFSKKNIKEVYDKGGIPIISFFLIIGTFLPLFVISLIIPDYIISGMILIFFVAIFFITKYFLKKYKSIC